MESSKHAHAVAEALTLPGTVRAVVPALVGVVGTNRGLVTTDRTTIRAMLVPESKLGCGAHGLRITVRGWDLNRILSYCDDTFDSGPSLGMEMSVATVIFVSLTSGFLGGLFGTVKLRRRQLLANTRAEVKPPMALADSVLTLHHPHCIANFHRVAFSERWSKYPSHIHACNRRNNCSLRHRRHNHEVLQRTDNRAPQRPGSCDNTHKDHGHCHDRHQQADHGSPRDAPRASYRNDHGKYGAQGCDDDVPLVLQCRQKLTCLRLDLAQSIEPMHRALGSPESHLADQDHGRLGTKKKNDLQALDSLRKTNHPHRMGNDVPLLGHQLLGV